METIYLAIVVFLLLLAVVDLFVGVSNDAVNFLNSAIGSKAAPFYVIILVAALGVFIGAGTSNGMMEIARHGIFHPEHFYFKELMLIFLAVMVTDIVLLDVFNSLKLPTSTTVSMVFELLGGTFAISMIKLAGDHTGLGFGDLLNTQKALTVILGIFLSVAIAFVFGVIVQYITRLIFSFNYKKNLKYTIGIFGGIALSSIFYFILVKGTKSMTFMTDDAKMWIHNHTWQILLLSFMFFAVLMEFLYFLKVNVFKIIVLTGTFALALAFAGNDLVNFIGVPVAGYSSFMDFVHNAHGVSPGAYTMGALNGPAKTPVLFLILAGGIMVFALVKSKKAQDVVKTSVDLSRQDESDEMFGSSALARAIVRSSNTINSWFSKITPAKFRAWIDSRFNTDDVIMEEGASFDLVRASVNLVLAGLLIIMGTSLQLPLSTTYVTFMVAMGSSLADRAWGRESAVFRITGVVSVIGGWFITAAVAFIITSIVATLMHYGGFVAMFAFIGLATYLLINSQITYRKKKAEEGRQQTSVNKILYTKDQAELWDNLRKYYTTSMITSVNVGLDTFNQIVNGFINEDIRLLKKANGEIRPTRDRLKKDRRLEMIGLRRLDYSFANEKSTWFHIAFNSVLEMNYCLKRMLEPCYEHVNNNFNPLPASCKKEYAPIASEINAIMGNILSDLQTGNYSDQPEIAQKCERLSEDLSDLRHSQIHKLRKNDGNLRVLTVYLNLIQESQELVNNIKHLVRGSKRFVK